MSKVLDILSAIWEDFRMSFSTGRNQKVRYPYPDEPKNKTEVSSMADNKQPSKLRLWWRKIWFGTIDPDGFDEQQPTTSEPLPVQPLEPNRSPRRKQLFKQKRREARNKWRKPLLWGCGLLAIIVVAIIVANVVPIGSNNGGNNAVADTTSSPTAVLETASSHDETASPSPSVTPDGTTWQMSEGNYAQNRWFGDGIAAIKKADTKAEAEEAANVWLDKVKRDPVLLAGAAKYFFPKKKISKDELVDDNGWATDKAVQLTSQIQIALAQSRVSPALAPKNGTNSGVANGMVVGAAGSGISGNRKAVLVVLPTGKKIWVMARCGNPVVMGPPPVPHGPTDQPLAPKKAGEDPYAQGNAPTGGGPNDDPGPGDYVKPSDMTQPPDKPYTPSPTPTPNSTPSGSGGQTATPDPQPTPPSEDDGGTNNGTV